MALATKVELRKEFLTKRNALDPAERAKASSLIRQRIFQNPIWRRSSTLLCYVSFGSEVETHTIIQEALRYKKNVVIPLHDPDKKGTPISELKRFAELGPNHRGVLQQPPEMQRLVDPARVELAIVPGIAFDRNGGRIGFGGGYFDRLLPAMPSAFVLGLAYESQIVDHPLPIEEHDVRMHAIVSEKAFYEFQKFN